MSGKITFKTIWHESGISALVLAALCIAYFLLETQLVKVGAGWAGIVKTILQIGKIVGCIWLMRFFMYRFKNAHKGIDRRTLRHYGYTVGILSGIVLSAVVMAYYQWNPDVVRNAIDTTVASMSQALDRNALDAIEGVENNFPRIVFFSNAFYCALWAVILSAILATKLIGDNPFEEDSEEDDDQ